MSVGRPRKSDTQKKREGTYRKDRAHGPVANFAAIKKIPLAPDSFDDVAKDVWNTICAELIKLNLLQSIDIFTIQIICNEMSIYWKAIKQMNGNLTVDTGTGSTKVNPYYTIATQALNNANRLAAQYGFTPTARMKLKIVGEIEKKKNPALDLIARKKNLK